MPVKTKSTGSVTTAYISGEIDHHSAASIRKEIDSSVELNMPDLLVLDFSGVSFMDSSGIGLIMGRFRLLQKTGAALNICGASPSVYKMMKLGGIDRLAKIEMGGFKVETDK